MKEQTAFVMNLLTYLVDSIKALAAMIMNEIMRMVMIMTMESGRDLVSFLITITNKSNKQKIITFSSIKYRKMLFFFVSSRQLLNCKNQKRD